MAKKFLWRPISITPTKAGKKTKIHIPQPEFKALQLNKRDVVKWEDINLEMDWFTLHKRGPRRAKVGEDPLEARAVPHDYIKGTLPERIVYYYLTNYLKFHAGIDFDFQSSMEGGRMQLGGLVVDFLFPYMRIIIQVQGPTHDTFLRKAKDNQQIDDLAKMGFTVYELEDSIIYDEFLLEEWMRRTFSLPAGVGGSGGAHGAREGDLTDVEIVYQRVLAIQQSLVSYFGV